MSVATPQKTAAYHARHALPKHARREWGRTGWTVSRLGFGGYRVDDITPEHAEALKLALRSGINLIDTSTNYTDGGSERLIGSVLQEFFRAGELEREEIVIVSKAGYVQGQNLQLAQERERQGRGFPEMVKYMQNCWHCIHPDFLGDQLFRSLARLQLEQIDVLLLHNPEYFLTEALQQQPQDLAAVRAEYEHRLREAFGFLEKQVAAGRIACYGVSSNTFPHASTHSEFTSLERLWEIAASLSPLHHFRVIQFPANLYETGAMLEKNQLGDSTTLLEFAREKKIATLANRPLNAMAGNGMKRLADFSALSAPEAEKIFFTQLAALAAAEEEFSQSLFSELNLARFVKEDHAIFVWAKQLADGLTLFRNWGHWDHVKQNMIEPQTEMALHFFREKSGSATRWQEWEAKYRQALTAVLATLGQVHAGEAAADSQQLATQLDASITALQTTQALSQKALRVLLNLPGLDVALLGMRRPPYVADGIAALRAEPLAQAWPALQSTKSK